MSSLKISKARASNGRDCAERRGNTTSEAKNTTRSNCFIIEIIGREVRGSGFKVQGFKVQGSGFFRFARRGLLVHVSAASSRYRTSLVDAPRARLTSWFMFSKCKDFAFEFASELPDHKILIAIHNHPTRISTDYAQGWNEPRTRHPEPWTRNPEPGTVNQEP